MGHFTDGPTTFTPTPRADCRGGGKRVLVTKHKWGWRCDVTPRQRDVYLYIRHFWRIYGYAPSYRDITEGLHLKAKKNIIRICKILRDENLIVMTGKYRDLRPVGLDLLTLVADRETLVDIRKAKRERKARNQPDNISTREDVAGDEHSGKARRQAAGGTPD